MPLTNEIRRLRFQCDEMTQAELASCVGVSRQTIIAIERNHRPPSLETAYRIAGCFDRELDAVFQFHADREQLTKQDIVAIEVVEET